MILQPVVEGKNPWKINDMEPVYKFKSPINLFRKENDLNQSSMIM